MSLLGDALMPNSKGHCESGVHAGVYLFFWDGGEAKFGAGRADVFPSTTHTKRKAAKSDKE